MYFSAKLPVQPMNSSCGLLMLSQSKGKFSLNEKTTCITQTTKRKNIYRFGNSDLVPII